ncbi:MAG: GGDEF domain-containing protein [Comamonadaceae bacterium]|nr:MAG: GGDEF domain-containing protein [Comamonadaceae bacterium]
MPVTFTPDLFALGLAVGVLGLILLLSLIIAYAYEERTLLGLAAYLSVMAGLALSADKLELGGGLVENLLLISGPSLVASLEMWLLRNRKVSKGDKTVMAAIGLVTLALMAFFAIGVYSWLAPFLCLSWLAFFVLSSAYLGIQSWDTVGPWKWWFVAGHAGGLLVAMCFLTGLADSSRESWPVLLMLLFQGPPIYLSLVWRSRLLNESRLRSAAANTTDPLTGLATTTVLMERLMRIMSRAQQGKTNATIFLIEVQNWNGLLMQLGIEFNEKLLLEAALRLRRSIGDNDVAARITGGRFAVLAQGLTDKSDVTALAMRLVVSGLRIDSPLLPGVELKFRVVVAELKYERVFNPAIAAQLVAGLAAHFAAWPASHRSRSFLTVAY